MEVDAGWLSAGITPSGETRGVGDLKETRMDEAMTETPGEICSICGGRLNLHEG